MRCGLLLLVSLLPGPQPSPDYGRLAARIVAALGLRGHERVMMRVDPDCFSGLTEPLRKQIRAAGAEDLRPARVQEPLTERLLERADVYVSLPTGSPASRLTPPEQAVLERWLAKGGARRALHFRWQDGDRRIDGLPAGHPPEFDALYESALETDSKELDAAQERAIGLFRLGTVRIHTPAGTDFMFRIGERPFDKQNGDASAARAQAARLPADREIDLPAGGLRAAPVEETAAGQIVLPEYHFGEAVARKVVVYVDNGRITGLRAAEGLEAVKAALSPGGEAARFGGFTLGLNPGLAVPAGSRVVPACGYGAGVIQLGFGGNQALGGNVRGDAMRWLFLTDASMHVDYRYLVRDGRLALDELRR